MNSFSEIRTYILRKTRVLRKKGTLRKELEIIKNKNFVIISDNCWGGEVYKWYNRAYNTPFVGLGIYGECYIKLLSSFDYYMGLELKFKPQNETKHPHMFKKAYYPMGLLGDIEIHFVHYNSEQDAKDKWDKRTKRMMAVSDKNSFFFKFCDDWKAEVKQFEQFHKLPFKNKVSFIPDNKKCFDHPEHIAVYERHRTNTTQVPNGVGLFKITFLYFDLAQWLSTSNVRRTKYYVSK
ncbi:DUF1919 domain-containing protein [uncultured Paraglaciecola sp.]|jgi:uncharacterized protein (DUF1919 family)|uniref:DUF1919 domain-containing protein n=1 Tax=uncultured Paraglaciecola sp. TaxID=1765024 RepID=UPI0025FA75BF|nr:DUF1919 domain-containing protein [uncultured Paraglaciecola sp.]